MNKKLKKIKLNFRSFIFFNITSCFQNLDMINNFANFNIFVSLTFIIISTVFIL